MATDSSDIPSREKEGGRLTILFLSGVLMDRAEMLRIILHKSQSVLSTFLIIIRSH